MRGGGKDALNEILLLRRHAGHAAAAALLAAIGRSRDALAVAGVGERKDALLLLDEILDVDLILDVLDLGQAVVAVLVADGDQLVLENAPNDQVIKLKALEALEKVADGKATKIIIPSEIQGLAGLAASTKALLDGESK